MKSVIRYFVLGLPLVSFLLLAISVYEVQAAKLVKVGILDQNYLVVNISDGEINYLENTGQEEILRYTPELNTTAATNPSSWTITSAGDSNYGSTGQSPLSCSRKKKLNGHAQMEWFGSDFRYEYTYEHWVYLELPSPLQQDVTYQLDIGTAVGSDTSIATFTFDQFSSVSEAIHVNLAGYNPDAPHKAADLYYWMGSGGARDYSSFEGNAVYLYNVISGTSSPVGTVAFWMASGGDVHNSNLTGSDVWNIDFSIASTPGTYRLVVEGVGCSQDFEIADDTYYDPFKVSVLGYFYMRIGESNPKAISPPPRTPLYIPEVSPTSTKVYLTTMHPYHTEWSSLTGGDKWDAPDAWAPYVKSGNPTPSNSDAWGGHSDAADWDRHMGHVVNIYDMLLPYLMSGGAINDDDLGITESGNGIPDLIDEARNEVDFWLRLRDDEGYSYGLTNPNNSNEFFQAGPTAIAAWANAANAAMLADAFRLAGQTELMNQYAANAIEAYNHASSLSDQMLDAVIPQDDGNLWGRDLKMMAAASLYNVNGERAYEDVINTESVCASGPSSIQYFYGGDNARNQLFGTASYLITPRTVHYPDLFSNMKMQIISEAKSQEADLMNTRPSRRTTYNQPSYWRTAHFIDRTIIAHAVTDDLVEKDYFRKALNLEADWGLGRNPLNMIEMTTATTSLASKRSVTEAYTSGRYDGVSGVHPGHAPYMNLDDWDTGMVMGSPSNLYENSFPTDVKSSWPIGETYFPSRWVWAHNEFTPRQTMRGRVALYGYLSALHESAGPTVPVTGVTLSQTSITINGSESQQLIATVEPANATNTLLGWESGNDTVAIVNGNGEVTGVAAGTVDITVTTVEGAFQATIHVTVSNITVTGISVAPSLLSLETGDTETITANVLPVNALNKNISWSSNNTAVATVNSNGSVSAVNAGSAIITATTQQGGFTNSCQVTIIESPDNLVLYRDSGGLTIYPWSDNGTLSQLTSGGQEGANHYQFSYSLVNWWAGIGFNFAAVDVSRYENLVIAVNGPSSSNNYLSVSVSDENSVSSESYNLMRTTSYSLIEIPLSSLVGSSGVDLAAINHLMIGVSGTQTGTGTFYVDNIYFGGSSTTVPVTGVTVNPSTGIINGGMLKLTATLLPSDASNTSVTWSSSNSSIASVNTLGQVMGNSVGSATITVTTQDGDYSSSAAIEVTRPTQGRILKVMPLGNSITEGYTIPGGYRLKLWQNLENAGLECGVDVVGSLHNNSTADLDDSDHEGHSGWTTGQILADIDNFMASATPDIVMMHLGTNDIAQGIEDEAPANLRGIIDHISGALPVDGKLYVAELIPMGGVGNGDSLAYNQMIADAVTEKQNQGLPVYLVDAYSIWPAGDSFYIDDWTHPNQQGYNALGDFWFDVIKGDIQLSCEGMVIKPGDVNSDGSVNLADAIITLQVLTGSSTTVTKDADVNGDNKIGIEEALYILQIQ